MLDQKLFMIFQSFQFRFSIHTRFNITHLYNVYFLLNGFGYLTGDILCAYLIIVRT